MKVIKAVTLYQPWASMIAIGEKRIETRSREIKFRGPIAIHAGKTNFIEFGMVEPFRTVLERHDLHYRTLPTGAIVAIAQLVDCRRVVASDQANRLLLVETQPKKIENMSLSNQEYAFGDYRHGRYVWLLDNIRPLPQPIPAKGHQSLWNWEVPEGVLI